MRNECRHPRAVALGESDEELATSGEVMRIIHMRCPDCGRSFGKVR
jgi:hypothetical protein